ncbi:type II toxin-antitoxin system RelE/ParE family toxin [Candidatus Woesearchaeota archaeon]|nr:type II toxin-antitoxin system RelE/ParE family toxin [Candidatus Woesearchaeota archaeon]MBI2661781.1 type II toxin-antitoxin system RelE/ParE family toxin [Candidatus Woesearchaeota archaeon]
MPYSYKFSSQLDKELRKLRKKDPVMHKRVEKKVLEIVDNPEPYKTLKYMQGKYKRVHPDPYVLLFTVESDSIEFLALEHHDKAYE